LRNITAHWRIEEWKTIDPLERLGVLQCASDHQRDLDSYAFGGCLGWTLTEGKYHDPMVVEGRTSSEEERGSRGCGGQAYSGRDGPAPNGVLLGLGRASSGCKPAWIGE
jgi:hypothetical protein